MKNDDQYIVTVPLFPAVIVKIMIKNLTRTNVTDIFSEIQGVVNFARTNGIPDEELLKIASERLKI
jgi:hypothetical protein